MIIREVEHPNFRDIFPRKSRIKSGQVEEENILNGIKLVGSGKGAIAIILKYLKDKNIIVNKLDEVLVPDWIGYWVYNQIQPFAFPAKKFSERTKVLMVYHQYGFPQDMDKILAYAQEKKLTVIEDCAHALGSHYKGKLLGTLGDFSIYSFSKFFFCFALGGVRSKFEDFSPYAEKLIMETPRGVAFIKDFSKFYYEKSTFSENNFYKKYASLLLSMSYSLYGEALSPGHRACRLLELKAKGEIALRKKRYKYYFDCAEGFGLCNNLEKEGIVPYVIPVICKKDKIEKIAEKMRGKGVVTGVYNFDINRNMLEPNFVECVWLPCHSGLSDEVFSDLVSLVLREIRR